jgi:hypothetical protein
MALAQSYAPNQGIGGLFTFVGGILNRVVPLLIALAVVYFIWQVFAYTIAGDEEKKKEAKTHIIWGIVGIFIMVSVWGLVAILQSTFGTSGVQENIGSQIPQI